MQQVNCWLEPEGDNYRLSVAVLPAGKRVTLGLAALQETCPVTLRGSTTTIKAILGWLDNFEVNNLQQQLDEAGMYAVGEYLYQQTLGQFPQHHQLPGEEVSLRIISTCPHIHRLPWNMLARDGLPLHYGWHIALAVEPDSRRVEWPALPAVLVVAPEPLFNQQGKRIEATYAVEHVQALRQRLVASIPAYDTPELFQSVTTWAELQRALQTQHFDVLYYYGHGIGDQYASRLLFMANGAVADLRSFQDVRQALQHAKGGAPGVCYINACFGNSGGRMGAGLQLGAVCAAVVANRTAAVTQTAMQQGQEFLERLLLEVRTPETALQDALTRCGSTSGDVRWVTPVLHCHYGSWQARRKPERFHLDKQDPHWEHKLDRITQSGELGKRAAFAIENRSPATVCCVWYGCDNVGVDLFHERIPLDLRALRLNVQVAHCRMDWPVTATTYQQTYAECLLAGLRNSATSLARAPEGLEGIPRFLDQLAGQTGKRTLFHLRLKTIAPGTQMSLGKLKEFLEWWQERVVLPILKPARIQTLMTLGFELPNPAAMPQAFEKNLEPLNDQYQDFSVYLLPQLPLLQRHDLREFIKGFYPDLPRDKANARIDYMMVQGGGNYQKTLDLLTDLNNDALYAGVQPAPNPASDDDIWSVAP